MYFESYCQYLFCFCFTARKGTLEGNDLLWPIVRLRRQQYIYESQKGGARTSSLTPPFSQTSCYDK